MAMLAGERTNLLVKMREKGMTGSWVSENSPKAPNVPEKEESNTPTDGKVDKKTAEEEELARLQGLLAQREAACLRLEGENYMLKAQVQQVQDKEQEMVKEVRSCQSYLAQAQQVLDCVVNGRMSLRQDVDQVRAVISAARRSVRKALHMEGPQAAQAGAGAGAGAGRVQNSSPPSARPRTSGARRPQKAGTHEMGSSQVSIGKSPKTGQRGNRPASGMDMKERGSPGRVRVGSAGTGGTTGSLSDEAKEAAAAAQPLCPDMKSPRPGPGTGTSGTSITVTIMKEVGTSTDQEAPVLKVRQAAEERAAFLLKEYLDLKEQSLQQRELLVAAVRRGSKAEASMLNMKDDMTRKEVIIYKLKEELGILKDQQLTSQQEAQNQQQQFESQLQLLQQQHNWHQMYQAQQYRQLEALLHAQLQPAAEEVSHEPVSEAEVSHEPVSEAEVPMLKVL